MKMLNATLVITFMLVSHAAFAERGATKYNRVTNVDAIAMHQDHEARELTPSDLTNRNP
ncbi:MULTISPECIES: hypothetical protein [unclassified Halomonas]|uniref:hypothetical protein n=1 Tax=unclassified Halomonas TaxID=2609666 RepID=UPI001CF3EFBC|nr:MULTISPECIES: hypothetical protein [unclassified Halomonas]UZH12061.1 hypothetical protein OM794_10125 [Halomonas sp. BDJS001]